MSWTAILTAAAPIAKWGAALIGALALALMGRASIRRGAKDELRVEIEHEMAKERYDAREEYLDDLAESEASWDAGRAASRMRRSGADEDPVA